MPSSPPDVLPLPGSFLVATPSLEDPNFHRTVLFILAWAEDEGALAVVVNRPNEVPVETVMHGWEEWAAAPPSLFVGGPVSRDSLICLAHLRPGVGEEFEGCSPIAGGPLATLDLHRQPFEVAPAIERLRIYSGYAGWAPGQLEGELEAGGWLVLDALPGEVFTDAPDALWRAVLRRQGGHVAMYANAPPKLSMN